jgi:hypothetical protein
MNRRIFYSWQSDLDGAITRNFIESALNGALKDIQKDQSTQIEPVLDRDTVGIPGSPTISDTIFAKIQLSDAFVADVSIINSGTGGRPAPNPNVLLELGFAVAHIGWDRIILIMNTVLGSPDTLPFDLRGRRVLPYRLMPSASDRPAVKTSLVGRLNLVLRSVLDNDLAGPAVPLWWGEWNISDNGGAHGGHLFIREVGPSAFLFDLSVFNGAHTGQINGIARIVAPNLAYARIGVGDMDATCELSFRRKLGDERWQIIVDETGECRQFRGMRARFAGTFIRSRSALFESGSLDELDLARLYSITGQYFAGFCRCFQALHEFDNLDRFVARVTAGGVAGLYTIVEGIVMRGEDGQLWAAYIDGDVLRYFTTERSHREKLPATIEQWRDRFKDKRVIFDSEVDRIPQRP